MRGRPPYRRRRFRGVHAPGAWLVPVAVIVAGLAVAWVVGTLMTSIPEVTQWLQSLVKMTFRLW